MLFHCNNCCKNASHWYVIRTLPVLFDSLGRKNLSAVHLKKLCRLVCSLTFPTLQPRPYILDIPSTLFYLLFSYIFSYLPHTWLHFFTFFISFHVIIIRSAAIFTPESLKAHSFYFRKLCENDGGSSFFSVPHESGILKVFSHSSEWKPLCSRNEVF